MDKNISGSLHHWAFVCWIGLRINDRAWTVISASATVVRKKQEVLEINDTVSVKVAGFESKFGRFPKIAGDNQEIDKVHDAIWIRIPSNVRKSIDQTWSSLSMVRLLNICFLLPGRINSNAATFSAVPLYSRFLSDQKKNPPNSFGGSLLSRSELF